MFAEGVFDVSVSLLSDLLDGHWFFRLLDNDTHYGDPIGVYAFSHVVGVVSGTKGVDLGEVDGVSDLGGVHTEREVNEVALGHEVRSVVDLDGSVEVLLELERQQGVNGLFGSGSCGGRCRRKGSSERLHDGWMYREAAVDREA